MGIVVSDRMLFEFGFGIDVEWSISLSFRLSGEEALADKGCNTRSSRKMLRVRRENESNRILNVCRIMKITA